MADIQIIELTAEIVSAHVSNNDVSAADVPALIQSVHAALSRTASPAPVEQPRREPAVSIRSSVKPDHIVCLEDGAKLKMLKRYLRTRYDMSPEDYRAKWGLPHDYPMVAPDYAEQRRTLAHRIGLGRKKVVEEVGAAGRSVKRGAKKAVEATEALVAGDKAPRAPRTPKAAKAAAQAHLGADESVDA